jgi:hypothetical protein
LLLLALADDGPLCELLPAAETGLPGETGVASTAAAWLRRIL